MFRPGHRLLANHLQLHGLKAVDPGQQSPQLRSLRLSQLDLGRQMQRQGHGGLIDAGAVDDGTGQSQPQFSRKLQLCEHFKKRDIS